MMYKNFKIKHILTESSSQIQMGIKVEAEHENVYNELAEYLEKHNVPMPWTKKEFFKKIAQAHLKEMSDYYTKLAKMES